MVAVAPRPGTSGRCGQVGQLAEDDPHAPRRTPRWSSPGIDPIAVATVMPTVRAVAAMVAEPTTRVPS